MCFWQNFSENAFRDFNNEGYNFIHKAELNIITIVNRMHMSCDFSIKHNLEAIEWKLIVLIDKNKSLISKYNRNWRQTLSRIFESYRV